MQDTNSEVKIKFRFFSNLLNDWATETLWAITVDEKEGIYKLDNIPFYAPVSCGDVVLATLDPQEGLLMYQETIEHSGNSTVQVIVGQDAEIEVIRQHFSEMGCESEKFNDTFFVMHIPSETDYEPIRGHLYTLETEHQITYAEPNLAKNHWY